MKLYWRIKKDGKWTWTPAVYDLDRDDYHEIPNRPVRVSLYWPEEEE